MSLLVRGATLVPLEGEPRSVADVLIRDGVIVEVGSSLPRGDAELLDAHGAWLLPGLWDAHVHFGQWVRSTAWLDVSGAADAAAVCAAVAAHPSGSGPLIGFGYRSAAWPEPATVAALDAAAGARPVILISGDAHNGWLNSAALRLLGLPARSGAMYEDEWFAVLGSLGDLPGAAPTLAQERAAVARLSSRGVVGIVDLEFSDAFRDWPARIAAGVDGLRVRTGVYAHQLDEVLGLGLRTGDTLPGSSGLATMGPLKVISDGSMSTRTAWCHEPYLDAAPGDEAGSGAPNVDPEDLRALLAHATAAGLDVAVHAIGDRANEAALDAFQATGARGSVEHAQLLSRADVPRFAALGVTAGVQPLHLADDRDTAGRLWGDRTDRLFPLRSLLDAGARLAFGSDAPVSEPDPWRAMAVAVHRTGDARPGWHQEEAITAREALVASVDGRRVRVGEPGDLVLVGADPLAGQAAPEAAAVLATMPVLATVCAGRVTYAAPPAG